MPFRSLLKKSQSPPAVSWSSLWWLPRAASAAPISAPVAAAVARSVLPLCPRPALSYRGVCSQLTSRPNSMTFSPRMINSPTGTSPNLYIPHRGATSKRAYCAPT
eukprot:TRINITY_DN2980_c0_g1_i4.p1 TRINITY_DN2980_c0_g1~~TRINITY_DN2980_c0_g1_i4.p1  ORF type:complete len:105 (-),score=7.65 TRINITY_DN2980_c0_g1_i4:486-800(-)